MDKNMNIHCFIFAWKGQYDNAVKLEEQLSKLDINVTVINSDENNTKNHWVTLNDEDYFSNQFRKALELFDESEYDFFWHIQSDASYEDWNSILVSAEEIYNKYNYGVYAPNVDDTFYISTRTDVYELEPNIKLVGTPDNTCWIIHRDFIDMMKHNMSLMQNNYFGWGWDLIISGFSHLAKRPVIRDYRYTINHPKSTGYKKELAEQEMMEMFLHCQENLKEVIYYIKTYPHKLIKYHNIENTVNDNIIIYRTS
jgi:hypothetical protein